MAVSNSLTTAKKEVGLTAYLTQDAVKNQIAKVVGGKEGQQFISSIISAVQINPQLQKCTNSSILSAALLGQSLKLSPSPQLGHFYMVPFNDTKRGTTEAVFQIGWKGIVQLAIRSGQYRRINVLPIKESELVYFDPLEEEIKISLIDDEEERENAATIGYYAAFELVNGFRKAMYWPRKKMESHALRYSMGYKAKKGYTFWEKDFDAMACKTMLRQLIGKWGIMSIDIQQAFEGDQAVIDDSGNRYPDADLVETAPAQVAEKKEEEKKPEAKKEDVAAALFGGNEA
jgi:recombination protein RecT